MEEFLKTPIAHRGLHNGKEIPENSLLAFEKAVKNGYGIELDIRATKDKKIVVFHDNTLNRMCNIKKRVDSLTFEELQKFRLYETDEKITLFKDVLKLLTIKTPLLIEIKDHKNIGILEKNLSLILDSFQGTFLICSFNSHIVEWFLKNRVDIKRALIFGDIKTKNQKLKKLLFLSRFYRSKAHILSLDYSLLEDKFIINFCKKRDIQVVSWTINSQKKMEKAKQFASNMIFETISF